MKPRNHKIILLISMFLILLVSNTSAKDATLDQRAIYTDIWLQKIHSNANGPDHKIYMIIPIPGEKYSKELKDELKKTVWSLTNLEYIRNEHLLRCTLGFLKLSTEKGDLPFSSFNDMSPKVADQFLRTLWGSLFLTTTIWKDGKKFHPMRNGDFIKKVVFISRYSDITYAYKVNYDSTETYKPDIKALTKMDPVLRFVSPE